MTGRSDDNSKFFIKRGELPSPAPIAAKCDHGLAITPNTPDCDDCTKELRLRGDIK